MLTKLETKLKRKIIVKTYTGKQQSAMRAFQVDVPRMAELGYDPVSQTWVTGSYGCFSFLFALILCFILVGFMIFIYMLIVKPAGTLSVTYELRQSSPLALTAAIADEKVCPRCAEKVKAAAKICRYCNFEFVTD